MHPEQTDRLNKIDFTTTIWNSFPDWLKHPYTQLIWDHKKKPNKLFYIWFDVVWWVVVLNGGSWFSDPIRFAVDVLELLLLDPTEVIVRNSKIGAQCNKCFVPWIKQIKALSFVFHASIDVMMGTYYCACIYSYNAFVFIVIAFPRISILRSACLPASQPAIQSDPSCKCAFIDHMYVCISSFYLSGQQEYYVHIDFLSFVVLAFNYT